MKKIVIAVVISVCISSIFPTVLYFKYYDEKYDYEARLKAMREDNRALLEQIQSLRNGDVGNDKIINNLGKERQVCNKPYCLVLHLR